MTCNLLLQLICEPFFDEFKKKFNYLNDIELIYGYKKVYDKYEEDLILLDSGKIPRAMLIDNRNLKGYEDEPVRLLLANLFFGEEQNKQNDMLLHELGHYFTDLDLVEIRQFISDFSNPFLPPGVGIIPQFVNDHNEGLNFIFQIPKLSLEVNAELWIYENEPEISKRRLKRYCDELTNTISEFQNDRVNREFFFEIPKLNHLILFRFAVIKHVKSDYQKECLSNIETANDLFIGLTKQAGWDGLKQIKYQDEILKFIEFKNQKISKLIELFKEILEEYIKNSVTFFPNSLQQQVKDFYDFS